MPKYLLFILISFFSFSLLNAEMVNEIEIKGNNRVSKETVKIYGKIISGKNYTESDLNKILKNLYATDFFDDIKIKIVNNKLIINLEEYPFINQLIIAGEKSNKYVKQIKKIIKLKEKRSFIEAYLINDVENIKNLYSSAGYNFTEVEIKTKKITDNSYDLLIEINRGEKTKIRNINFLGNKSVSNRRLKDIIASEEDKFWKVLSKNTNFTKNLIELDTRLLLNYYRSSGFYDVKINSKSAKLVETNQVDLDFNIDEGTRYRINKISTNADSVFDKKIFLPLEEIYKKYVGEYYSPFKIKKLLEDLDRLIEENNLQFVEHNVQEIIQNNEINIILNVFEGEKKLVELINITGNTVTNESVIRGELILDEGDPYSKLNLDKSISEIKARGIFKNVKYEVLEGTEKNLKIININVEEQPTGEITAGAGIGTDGGLFALGVKENNWLGTGKTIAIDFEIDNESLSGVVNYRDPNYDFLGNTLNYSISNETNDKSDQGYENTLTAASVGTSFEQYKDVYLSLGLSASYDDLRTDSSASAALKKQEGTYNEISGNYGLSMDTRDRPFMPSSGSILTFSQSLPIYADKSFVANRFSASKYKYLNENIVGVGKLYLAAINGFGSDDVRISKRQVLSTNRLRGFERNKIGPVDNKDHVGGNYAAALNFEANLPTILPDDTNADVSVFIDFGNVWGVDYDSSLDDSNKIRSSTGVIANWMSPLGPMNFVFSQNISKAETDKTQGFSFNLGTTF